jgi:predicted flap endonuclease-1-like 5' DNA nuclease
MITAETLWLRSQAAQQNVIQLAKYNSAFVGTAMIQAMQMGLKAPQAFWGAMARASDGGAAETVLALKPTAPEAPKSPAKAKRATGAASTPEPVPAPAAEPVAVTASAEVIDIPAPAAPAPQPVAAVAADEPAAAEAVPAPAQTAVSEPVPEAVEAPAAAAAANAQPGTPPLLDAPRGGTPDDLTTLAGVGPKLAASLNEVGIYHFDQIAALNEDGIAWLDDRQKGFKMLAARYDIVGQAKALT